MHSYKPIHEAHLILQTIKTQMVWQEDLLPSDPAGKADILQRTLSLFIAHGKVPKSQTGKETPSNTSNGMPSSFFRVEFFHLVDTAVQKNCHFNTDVK